VHSNKGRIRIIGGEYRGRRISVPDRRSLRPTPDRVRETLFNWLGQSLQGLACLDLFAGSGALGFEAASRGAARVVLVDHDRLAFQALKKTFDLFKAPQVELVCEEAFAYLESSEPVAPAALWRELKRQRAGQVSYQLFEWRGHDQGGLPGNV
jgi:16S rRNA (guanine966-N2)-methyltransferase